MPTPIQRRKTAALKPNKSPAELRAEFNAGDPEDLFNELYICAVLGACTAKIRRDRICNRGPAYVKIGNSVRYRKRDVLAFIDANTHQTTQTEAINVTSVTAGGAA